jgi:hypothetical protein
MYICMYVYGHESFKKSIFLIIYIYIYTNVLYGLLNTDNENLTILIRKHLIEKKKYQGITLILTCIQQRTPKANLKK